MTVTGDYSGVVLNQNAIAANAINWRTPPYNAQTIYQTFYLPGNYQLGTSAAEQRLPDLSGFQVLANVDRGYASFATLDYTLDYYIIGQGWSNLTSGTVIGVHADGPAWFDLIFPVPVKVTTAISTSLMRIGVTSRMALSQPIRQPVTINPDGTYVINGISYTANLTVGVPSSITVGGQPAYLLLHDTLVTYSIQQGVSGLWYISPTPLVSQGQAYRSDGTTPLLGVGTTASINFRVLALTADHGTDFLGNEFRSCVVRDTGNQSATTNPSWMSPPQPSRFAVLSRYFDVRPTPGVPTIGAINLVPDGSFEHDGLETIPFGISFYGGAAASTMLIENGWAAFGTQALRYTSTLTGGSPLSYCTTALVPVAPNQTYYCAATVNVLQVDASTGAEAYIQWFTSTGTLISQVQFGFVAGATGVRTITGNAVAPANASQAALIVGLRGDAGFADMYIDGLLLTATNATKYFDGDNIGYEWLIQTGRSASAQLIPVTPTNQTIVIDGVLIDPLTPNVAVNIYYSEDDAYTSTHMTERDWEQKLWTRVPEVYVLTQRLQCIFPQPVRAKYVKLEFTNLQAQAYTPGNFQAPLLYKKFPTWVADFFIAQLSAPSFISTIVGVTNDALDFAYNYYLDDLNQRPADPLPAPSGIIPNLTQFFTKSDASNSVDASTLNQISLIMRNFQVPTGSITSPTLLGQFASNIINSTVLPPANEIPLGGPIDYSLVSTLSREPVILEQALPTMYFFVPCRHTYKELSATLDLNRAFFAGVQDIAFLRANYATTTDTDLYIESGNDSVNAQINDFIVDTDLNWYAY